MAKVLCLLYHRINVVKDNIYNLVVLQREFEEQIRYLKEHFNILRFEDDWSNCESDSVVITFDDGYADNFTYALPILEKYQVPATIFVSTGNLGTTREFWWDELGRLLTQKKEYPEYFELQDSLYHYTWETKTEGQREELAKTLRWVLRMEPDSTRTRDWFEQLKAWGGITDDIGRKENISLNLEQLQELSLSKYITLGAHTVNHLSLGALSKESQEDEIVSSIDFLQARLNRQVDIFSYPFGSGMDYNGDTLEICRKYGIKKAATTKEALWSVDCDPLLIPRFSVKNGDIEEFKKMIGGFMGV